VQLFYFFIHGILCLAKKIKVLHGSVSQAAKKSVGKAAARQSSNGVGFVRWLAASRAVGGCCPALFCC
jgi:hypothetical protein